MNLKNSGDSTGFEPMTSAMPVQCSNQLSYEVTQWRAGQLHITFNITYSCCKVSKRVATNEKDVAEYVIVAAN